MTKYNVCQVGLTYVKRVFPKNMRLQKTRVINERNIIVLLLIQKNQFYFCESNKYEEALQNTTHYFIYIYLHLPSIFPIKCVGGPSLLMRA